jgi:DNA-binding transcriptional MocR family regulator
MILELDRESHVPLYTQIAERMREKMREGALKVGDRLPPNRELAKSLGVNRGTVTTAYDELMADGLLSSQVGRGTFVSALPAGHAIEAAAERAPASPMPWGALLTDERRDPWLNALAAPQSGAISFAHALPPAELFPLDAFRRSVERVLRKEGRQLLSLGSCKGYEPLRQYLSAQMALSGIHAQPDEILITMVASEQGVTFCPGELFYASAPQSNRMRLAFSTATPAQIEDGVRRVGALLKTKLAAAKQPRWFGQATGVQTMV